jgi:hypothetical protein
MLLRWRQSINTHMTVKVRPIGSTPNKKTQYTGAKMAAQIAAKDE